MEYCAAVTDCGVYIEAEKNLTERCWRLLRAGLRHRAPGV
ncbi:hypothetical protein GPB2148_3525 [marine gamma proteobacterium HTCC2148]|nr:hypothetical protein GPB2148_3525 [marine gamma proteobacterium HTCC2148]